MLIERVLIHPIDNGDETRPFLNIWKEWASIPTTKIIPAGDLPILADTAYLEHVQNNLIVGGQSGSVCVYNHLTHLAEDVRVRDREINIQLSWEATLIKANALDYIIRKILAEQQVVISVVK